MGDSTEERTDCAYTGSRPENEKILCAPVRGHAAKLDPTHGLWNPVNPMGTTVGSSDSPLTR